MEFPDAEARRAIREDLDVNLFVEAAAGTGKTSALVERIVALLRTGTAELERIVAVTFTEKAAGEMKLRVRGAIETTRRDPATSPEERRNLEDALSQLELARITTVHAFCGDLLHERPVEAGVDPRFGVAPDDESQRLLDQAFESWFQEVLRLPAGRLPEGVRRVLRRRARGAWAQGPREQLRGAVRNLVEHRDFPGAWRREPFQRGAALEALLEELGSLGGLAEIAAHPDSWLGKNIEELARAVGEIRLRQSVAPDVDALEADLRELGRSRQIHWHWKGHPRRPFAPGLEADIVRERRDAAKAELDRLLDQADADLAACLQAELQPVIERYEALKQGAGKLDFLDLLLRARTLLAENPEVLAHYRERFTHFFVDEFQDTDPLQAEIMQLLAGGEPGRLFVVGDPKQSIYRFRRADLGVYRAVRDELARAGARVLHLTTSFRAVPSLQDAVNDSFEEVLPEYVPLEHHRPEHPSHPEQPSLVSLPVPDPYGHYGRMVEWRIRETYPDAVGGFVEWLLTESGWTVEEGREEGETERVPVAARHVCLLLRRFKRFRDDVTRPYVRALEGRRIPHVLVGGRSFHEREEVLAVRNALCTIEWPEDELRVFATLRGPFFALGDDALLAWRHRVAELTGQTGLARLHPLRPLGEDVLEKLGGAEREVADALAILADLHRRRNHRPVAETLTRLLAEVRAHAGLAIWPTGEQALANVLRTVDVARRWERGGAPSFRAFVEHLESEAERGEAQDAPVVEEGTEGVRIMTVHRAKGLEFPVVILVDPTCNATQEKPSRHVDAESRVWAETLCGCTPHDLLDAQQEELARDREESDRLAYVAATRARDLLVLPVVAGDDPGPPEILDKTWLESLHTVAYRPEYRFPLDSLRLEAHEDVGLRQQRILQADESGGAAEESERAHAEWAAERERALASGAEPSLRVATVTASSEIRAEAPPADAPPIAVEETDASRSDRPGGKRFGTLVHVILERVPLGADSEAVARRAAVHGRLLGATEAEIEAAAQAAGAALAHPLLRRARASTDCRREVPVLLRETDGSLIEGVVDLAFLEDDAWTVIDFKTDRAIGAEDLARYEAQVRLYSEAIARATGLSARGVLLRV
jgi:ATP-dependent helicase/nuclease subunit A